MVAGDDVRDELLDGGLRPARGCGVGAGGRDLAFDLLEHDGGVEIALGAGVGQGDAATAAEVDVVSGEDAGGEGMPGGDLADSGCGGDVHGVDLLRRVAVVERGRGGAAGPRA